MLPAGTLKATGGRYVVKDTDVKPTYEELEAQVRQLQDVIKNSEIYKRGYQDGMNDATEDYQKRAKRHTQPIMLEAQELSVNLAVIAATAAVMGQGRNRVSDVIKDAITNSYALMKSLDLRVNRAEHEGVQATIHNDGWIQGLLNEASAFYEQTTTNDGSALRAYVGNLDSALGRVIEARTENRPREDVIDRLCVRLHEYVAGGKFLTIPKAYDAVESDLKLMSHKRTLTAQTTEEYNLLVVGKWGVKNARKAYSTRYGGIRSIKNAT